MVDFEERITCETPPQSRLEHDVRYRSVRSLVMSSRVWCDLGCGSGVAAAAALEGRYPGRAVLVDIAEDALREAEHRIAAHEVHAFRADLASENDLEIVHDALFTDLPDNGCITCFELVEHLVSFAPLVQLLVEAAETGRYTVILSVPNDAFTSIQNPFHQTVWGESAFEEFKRLLPADHLLAVQVELRGSTLTRVSGTKEPRREAACTIPEAVIASHFIAAFGPRAELLEEPMEEVQVTDREAQRMWERQRDSDLAYYRAIEAARKPRPAATRRSGRIAHRPPRERRLRSRRPSSLGRCRHCHRACTEAHRQARMASRARAGAPVGRPSLGASEAPRTPCAFTRRCERAAVRRRGRNVVETTSSLFTLSAHRYCYFVQSLEDRFYLPGQHADRFAAAVTYSLPVTFLTEARWIAQALEEGRRGHGATTFEMASTSMCSPSRIRSTSVSTALCGS